MSKKVPLIALLILAATLLEVNIVRPVVINRDGTLQTLPAGQIPTVSAVNSNFGHVHTQSSVTDNKEVERVFLSPQKAKTLLRRKRDFGVLFGILMVMGFTAGVTTAVQESNEESEESSRRAAEHARFCRNTCWGEWQAWSACSLPCGISASRTRGRQRSPPHQCVSWVNSNGCRGASTQSAPCNSACHNGGTLRSTDCTCPPTHRGRCCEHRVTCVFPGKPTHGAVIPAGTSHGYGDRVRFSCDTGYLLHGSTSRTCQSNGRWSDSVPTCRIIQCGDPGPHLHGKRIGDDFVFNARVVYSCAEGYLLVGSVTRVCQANGHWSPSAPTCQAVDCGSLEAPAHGTMTSMGSVFEDRVTFSCNEGFYMEGSSRRVCQANGQWNGAQAVCSPINCTVTSPPLHGDLRPGTPGVMPYGSTVEFSCNEGYTLHGSASRTCTGSGPQGFWTGSQTSCRPVNCGNPGTPDNGVKEGGSYVFSSVVAYTCQPGYKINGAVDIQCQADGTWTYQMPQCEACPVNSYKAGLNAMQECVPCPENSHTWSVASDNFQLCACDGGFIRVAGNCLEIVCPPLSEPLDGRFTTCDNHVGESCHMTCDNGHIRIRGDAIRTCHEDGAWSGHDLVCQACPQNTYKDGEEACVSCPENSRTSGTGHNITGCVCDHGFSGAPGGPCTDLDECVDVANCSQSCVNTYGSFYCECDLPGYILSEEDPTKCITGNQCPQLEAPSGGGLLCLQSSATNTRRCSVRCNPGFEHILRVNEFEECGPSTNWMWSNQIDDRLIPPCIEKHFVGVEVEAETAYLVDDCEAITDSQMQAIAQQFVSDLEGKGVCVYFGEAVCSFEDVSLECGMMLEDDYFYSNYYYDDTRYKRSAEDIKVFNLLKVRFKLAVQARAQHNVDCLEACQESNMHLPRCQDMCQQHYLNSSTIVLARAESKLQRLFGSRTGTSSVTSIPRHQPSAKRRPIQDVQGSWQSLSHGAPELPTITVEGLTLRPLAGLKTSAIQRMCATGMILHDNACVPCPPGSFFYSGDNRCILCPRGTYQPDEQQTECLPCSHHTSRGAMHCLEPFKLEHITGIRRGSN